jgi:hypothetical protein
MYICVKCKKEMECIHNGTKVRYSSDGSHVYPGDRFRCKVCGYEMVACNTPNYHDNNVRLSEEDVCMEEIHFKQKPINLRRRDEPRESEPRNNQLDPDPRVRGILVNTSKKITDSRGIDPRYYFNT